MKQQYDPKSEDVFKDVWYLSDISEDETIVKNLYKELANLKIQSVQDSDNSESSTNTVIETEEIEKSPEKEKGQKFPESNASRPPIPGGQESNIVRSLGMESTTKLDTATGTEDSKNHPQDSSRKYKYGTQVVHKKDCTCPYFYVRKISKKKKLSFSINAAQMVKTFR